MMTFIYSDPNSPMARRRLLCFTGTVFLLIVLLIIISHMVEKESQRKPPKQYYTGHLPSQEHNAEKERLLQPFSNNDTLSQEKKIVIEQSTVANTKNHYISDEWDPSTLTRFGGNLNFDYISSCPSGSTMLTDWKSKKPETTRCPQLFIIGTKKGGTTSLYQYLSKHPNFEGIRLHESKWIGETFYFAQNYGVGTLPKYVLSFPKNKMSGDASVDNLVFCHSPARILRTCGKKSKIIILLRNPIERYISHFMMRVDGLGYTAYNNYTSIAEVTEKELNIIKNAAIEKGAQIPSSETEWYSLRCLFSCCKSMIYEGLYYVFVMNWLCNFPKENILFLNSEEMFEDPVLILRQVLTFLGLKPLDIDTLYHITSHVYNRRLKPVLSRFHLSPDDRRKLSELYKPYNDALLELLDWQRLDWS